MCAVYSDILRADSPELYDGLRELWTRVFGDESGYVDRVYETIGERDISGYVICESGRVVSALTCFRCGELMMPQGHPCCADLSGRPVYVSYAVCTDPEHRGRGLAGKLTEYARGLVTSAGGISLVSPASAGLEDFYRRLGYTEGFFADEIMAEPDDEEWITDPDDPPEDPRGRVLAVFPLSAENYGMYRETFLADVPHVKLTQSMLRLVLAAGPAEGAFLMINGGDAVCALEMPEPGGKDLMASELLVSPELASVSGEIAEEIGIGLAEYLGQRGMMIRTPQGCGGFGRCQSMYSYSAAGGIEGELAGYFGFPMD